MSFAAWCHQVPNLAIFILSLIVLCEPAGCQCGFTGSKQPVIIARINLTCLWTMGETISRFEYTRLKTCQLTDFAPTSVRRDRRKRSGVSISLASRSFSHSLIFLWFRFSSHVTCAVIIVLMSDLFLWCTNPFGAHSDIVMRDNTLAIKQLRQTRTNMSATFFLSVTRNVPLPHRLVVCMWK